MTDFAEYLNFVKEKAAIKNDKKLSQLLGVTPNSIYKMTKGASVPSDDLCIKIAEISGDDPERVLLIARKSKATPASRPYWENLLKKNVPAALPFLIISSVLQLVCDARYIMLN